MRGNHPGRFPVDHNYPFKWEPCKGVMREACCVSDAWWEKMG